MVQTDWTGDDHREWKAPHHKKLYSHGQKTDSYLPRNPYVEAITPNMTIFGDRTYREVVKVERDHKGEVLI